MTQKQRPAGRQMARRNEGGGSDLAPTEQVKTIKGWLFSDDWKRNLVAALGRQIDYTKFARLALSSFERNYKLLEAAMNNPKSLLLALLESAQSGLDIDTVSGHAFLVPYKGEVKFQRGYKGLVDLAYRHPRVGAINWMAVYSRDTYDYNPANLREPIKHKPTPAKDRGELIAVWVQVSINGSDVPVHQWMWRHEIEAIRDQSVAYKKGAETPWHNHFEAMALKTAMIRCFKRIPAAKELTQAIAAEERMEADLDAPSIIDMDLIDEPQPVEQPQPHSVGQATARVASRVVASAETAAQTKTSMDPNAGLKASIRNMAQAIGLDQAIGILGGIGFESLQEVSACNDRDLLLAAVDALKPRVPKPVEPAPTPAPAAAEKADAGTKSALFDDDKGATAWAGSN